MLPPARARSETALAQRPKSAVILNGMKGVLRPEVQLKDLKYQVFF
jgi:hypothetical protein